MTVCPVCGAPFDVVLVPAGDATEAEREARRKAWSDIEDAALLREANGETTP